MAVCLSADMIPLMVQTVSDEPTQDYGLHVLRNDQWIIT